MLLSQVLIIIIIALLSPFQEKQQSDLEHFANVYMKYSVTKMSEECFICSTNHRVCKRKRRRKLRHKAQKSLVNAAETQKDDLIITALSIITSVCVTEYAINTIFPQEMLTKR